MKRLTLAFLAFTLVAALPACAQTRLIDAMKRLALDRQTDEAISVLEKNRGTQASASDPEWLASVSWAARAAGFAERWDVAEKYAQEAYDGSLKLLDKRGVDDDPFLPTALGASIEVLGKVYNVSDHKAAVDFLSSQRAKYRGTSIETRIQKNFLSLQLEGESFPALEAQQFVGKRPPTSAELKGKVVLYYFWAHWCSDCRIQKPILDTLYKENAAKGFSVVGPTRFWGYVAGGEDASPERELEYLKTYPTPSWMPVPISEQNFANFGVSTTPTLVLVDRAGTVRLYHPGRMSYDELRGQIEPLLQQKAD